MKRLHTTRTPRIAQDGRKARIWVILRAMMEMHP
jgi:hypothetical protein